VQNRRGKCTQSRGCMICPCHGAKHSGGFAKEKQLFILV
jgi:hypothetical protein